MQSITVPGTTPTEAQVGASRWMKRRIEKQRRLKSVAPWLKGHVLAPERINDALQLLIQTNDRVVIEGDNQKQADFLSRSLVQVDPKLIHDLHIIISSISRPEHLTLFEKGIARKADFAFAGPRKLESGTALGRWHTSNRSHSHLRRAVCSFVHGLITKCGVDLRRTRRLRGQSIHWTKHGRYTGYCGICRFS